MGKYSGLFIGLTTIDIQYFVDDFPAPNTKVKTNPPDIMVGVLQQMPRLLLPT